MELGDIIQYISILIAARAIFSDYDKVKIKLIPRYWIYIFAISGIGILVIGLKIGSGHYHDLSNFFMNIGIIKSLVTSIRGGDFKQSVISILRIANIMALMQVSIGGKLRNSNKKEFQGLLISLLNQKEYNLLSRFIEDNIEQLIQIGSKRSKKYIFFEQFKPKITINISIHGAGDSYTIGDKNKWYDKIIYSFKGVFIESYNIDECLTNYDFIKYIYNNKEYLGYQIIRSGITTTIKPPNIQFFSRVFFKLALQNDDSEISRSLIGLEYSPIQYDNVLLNELKLIGPHIDFPKMIDEVISIILHKPENYNDLNKHYYPGSDVYEKNSKLILHIRHLLQTYKLFEKIDISNLPIFMVKDIIEVTNQDKFTEGKTYEFVTGTYYLLYELFNLVEELIDEDKLENSEIIGLYFPMLYMLLSSNANNAIKKTIVKSRFYFLCKNKNKDKKIEGLKDLIGRNPEFKEYFQLDDHDRIKHYYNGNGKNIFEILK